MNQSTVGSDYTLCDDGASWWFAWKPETKKRNPHWYNLQGKDKQVITVTPPNVMQYWLVRIQSYESYHHFAADFESIECAENSPEEAWAKALEFLSKA